MGIPTINQIDSKKPHREPNKKIYISFLDGKLDALFSKITDSVG